VYSKDNSHIKYLIDRFYVPIIISECECEIGEAESIFNQYIRKSENVPKAKDIIRLGCFLEENR
jgi:hypothetical protein